MFRRPIAALASALSLLAAASAGELWVTIDEVTRYQMPDGVGQVVLTNPAVADVQVASATEIMLFGRAPGHTEVLFRAADGSRLGTMRVRVRNPRDGIVTMYRGGERVSLSCADRCEPTMVVGDGANVTGQQAMQQAQAKMAASEARGALRGEKFKVESDEAPASVTPAEVALDETPGT